MNEIPITCRPHLNTTNTTGTTCLHLASVLHVLAVTRILNSTLSPTFFVRQAIAIYDNYMILSGISVTIRDQET
jgi:hypothetical protein